MAPARLNFNTFVTDSCQLSLLKPTCIREILLEHEDLSRFGRLSTSELKSLIDKAYREGFSSILQWDILATDAELLSGIKIFKQLPLSQIAAVRVQDLGIAQWMRQHFPDVPLHLVAETGNHNLASLQQWCNHFGEQLNRLVLSTEIPGSTLKQYCSQLEPSCEILGLGRILLFYTPRSLLLPLQKTPQSSLEKIVASDDQPHHQFPTLENRYGTFMFHYYDLFLLDLLPELQETALHTLRIDLRFIKSFDWIQKIDSLREKYDGALVKTIKAQWPVHTIHGFFRANRTDRAIRRLKNKHLSDHGKSLVAYVVESIKDQYTALISRQPFHADEELLFITPEGRKLKIVPRFIRNTEGEATETADNAGVWLIPHYKWVIPKTLIYRL